MHYYDLHESPRGGCCSSQTAKDSPASTRRPEISSQVEQDWRRDARHAPLRQAKRELANTRRRAQALRDALAPEGTRISRPCGRRSPGRFRKPN